MNIVKRILTRFHLRGLIRTALETPSSSASGGGALQRKQDQDAATELKRVQEEVLVRKRQSKLRRQASFAAGIAMEGDVLDMENTGGAGTAEADDYLSGFELSDVSDDKKKDGADDVNNTNVRNDDADEKVSLTRHASLATAAARYKRVQIEQDGQTGSLVKRPDCETVYLNGSDPSFFDGFLSSSFEQLVMHNNAYFSSIPGMNQANLEKAMGNLTALWRVAWKISDVDGEVLGDDPSLYANASTEVVPAVGAPMDFNRAYCSS